MAPNPSTISKDSNDRCRISLAEVGPALVLAGVIVRQFHHLPTTDFRAVALRIDSRRIVPGDVFLAIPGTKADGHNHLKAAAKAGAALLIIEKEAAFTREIAELNVPTILVKQTRAAWSELAAAAYGHPERKLRILGITGTNGKSSTVWMIRELLALAGTPILSIGTLGAYLGDAFEKTTHTTPDPDHLYGLMAEAVKMGLSIVAMEVSSHAIAQEKLRPIRYIGAAFTSFSRDHLDFHPDMADYFATKWRLFSQLSLPRATFAFAAHVPVTPSLLSDPKFIDKHKVVYGPGADEQINYADDAAIFSISVSGFAGTDLTIGTIDRTIRGKIPYFANHALENFVAALTLASAVEPKVLDPKLWPNMKPVPGRLEQVLGKSPVAVVVDYAHTPDALEKTLMVLRPFASNKLRVVFGCGGDRDRGKRPEMGRIAERLADAVYLTSDNPRSEDPEKILADIATGLAHPERAAIDPDRERMIARAIRESAADDLVVIAGKGHETYQILAGGTVDFDDRSIARKYLNL